MANLGFGITGVQVNKVLGGKEWSNDVRLNCYMIASIAELPDDTAKAKFVSLCNSLGIVSISKYKYSEKVNAEMFALRGTDKAKVLDDVDKRKAIAAKMFPELGDEGYKQLNSSAGVPLNVLYESICGKDKDDLPFVMYRLSLGDNLVYRICQNNASAKDIVKDAIRYLVSKGNGQESDYPIDMPKK